MVMDFAAADARLAAALEARVGIHSCKGSFKPLAGVSSMNDWVGPWDS